MHSLPHLHTSMRRISQFIGEHSKGKLNADSFLLSCRESLERSAFSYVNSSRLGYQLDDQYKDFIRRNLNLRAGFFCDLYLKINHALSNWGSQSQYMVSFLDGDSHNKGQRPILLQRGEKKWVLKITDPRTSLIYNSILYRVYESLCIPLPVLKIVHDRDYSYQITPYLQSQPTHTHEEIENYARCLGAHLATSYFLSMTDLHIENVMTCSGYPHIIDTECMLCDYDDLPSKVDQLIHTGLIAPKKNLSGICGGDNPISKLELTLSKSGSTRYTENKATPSNRISDKSGKIAPISSYKKPVLDSFIKSYEFINRKKNELVGSIDPLITDSVRTRFLIRTTAHYKTVVDRIYSPSKSGPHDLYLESTLSAFRASGHIPEIIDPKLMEIEIIDLLAGDIPFFWACPQGGKIMHWSGIAMNLPTILSFKNRLERAVFKHSMKDLDNLNNHLKNYL